MKVNAYLKIKKDGELSVSKYKPTVGTSEVCTLLNFDIPDVLFDKPVLEANIKIMPPPATSVPNIVIEAGALVDWIDKKK